MRIVPGDLPFDQDDDADGSRYVRQRVLLREALLDDVHGDDRLLAVLAATGAMHIVQRGAEFKARAFAETMAKKQ